MGSTSSESSSSSSSSESSDAERRRREKKERKRKREKEERRSSKKERHAKKGKDKDKDRKREKKDRKSDKKRRKKEKEALRATASGAAWGKYGIIKEGDMYPKQEEFLAWLTEVKGVAQEACGQRELKEHFSSFCEDYNTATMPSDKYYDLRAWYQREQRRVAVEGAAKARQGGFERSDFDDEGARRREMAREREKRSVATTKIMASAMSAAGNESSLVADMREQEEAKKLLRATYMAGDVTKAREMSEKLDPKYVSPEELKKIFGGPAPLNSKKPGGMGGGH